MCSTCRSSRRSTDRGQRLNALQFLTIRQYLSVVFGALVSLLLVARVMALIGDLAVQILQMLLVLARWRRC